MSTARRARIAGTGKAVPGRVVTNDDLAKIVETSDEWIRARSGIQERRFLEEGRTTSDLAAEAGRKACESAEIAPSELDLIICATISPDMPLPAVAVTVQEKLGAKCPAFDMAAACAGFIYGLSVGDAFVRGGSFGKVLVIGVEVLSRSMDLQDRNTCVLFGDGAGAVVLVPSSDDRGILSTHIYADGSLMPLLNIPAGGTAEPASHASIEARHHYIKMQGKPVFTHAVKKISDASMAALQHNQLSAEQIDCVVAHQANLRILEGVAERCKLPLSKFYLNIHKYGNTSSASIPIALDEAVREGRIKPGDMLLFAALGAGLSWGSAVVKF
jgi:3-oxoacyl-[acyl-carrier-protein] synthase III